MTTAPLCSKRCAAPDPRRWPDGWSAPCPAADASACWWPAPWPGRAHLPLDEPTDHLGARAQLELGELLGALPQTRVAVLHDLDHALAHSDQVAMVDSGILAATGPPGAPQLPTAGTSRPTGGRDGQEPATTARSCAMALEPSAALKATWA
ncbi:hypothetical protein GCM10023162_12580 [Klenkia terrae]